MNNKNLDSLLDALVKEIKNPSNFSRTQDLLLKRGIQSLLKAERWKYIWDIQKEESPSVLIYAKVNRRRP